MPDLLLIGLIAAALLFDFMNGMNDAANSIATIVSTRVLSPRYAVIWAAFFNFIAFLVFGQAVAKTIMLFEVDSFEPHMEQMGEVIVQTAKLTVEAVALLQTLRQQSHKVNEVTEAIIRLEESADDLNNHGVKALYLKHRDGNAMDYMIGNDIYNHLERVMDRFEDVANGISGLAIEQS